MRRLASSCFIILSVTHGRALQANCLEPSLSSRPSHARSLPRPLHACCFILFPLIISAVGRKSDSFTFAFGSFNDAVDA